MNSCSIHRKYYASTLFPNFFAISYTGKVKTDTIGPWTPPVTLAEFTGNRFYCTNQNGIETLLDECFRIRHTNRPLLFIYKRLVSKQVRLYAINPSIWSQMATELMGGYSIREILQKFHPHNNDSIKKLNLSYLGYRIFDKVPLSIHICMRKRIDNNVILGLELSFIFDTLRTTLRQVNLSKILHIINGLTYSLLRDDVIEHTYGPDPHNEGAFIKIVNENIDTNEATIRARSASRQSKLVLAFLRIKKTSSIL
jgi:hypothetical protein